MPDLSRGDSGCIGLSNGDMRLKVYL